MKPDTPSNPANTEQENAQGLLQPQGNRHADTPPWYHILGFRANPLNIRPTPQHLTGFFDELSRAKQKMLKGDAILITGNYGTGKTTLLKRIAQELKKQYHIIYHSQRKNRHVLDIHALIDSRKESFIRRLFNKDKKKIIMIDEAQHIRPLALRQIQELLSKQAIHSAILSTTPDYATTISDYLPKQHTTYLKTKKLTQQLAQDMLDKRLGQKIFSPSQVRQLLAHNVNPRKFLQDAGDTLQFAIHYYLQSSTDETLQPDTDLKPAPGKQTKEQLLESLSTQGHLNKALKKVCSRSRVSYTF